MSKSVSDLVSEYRLHAVEHGAATEKGDHKKANKHHDRLLATLRSLRDGGADGEQALLGLLEDQSSSVRCWAASHCLKIDENLARRVLEVVSSEPGIIGFNARMVLSEWNKGTLKVP